MKKKLNIALIIAVTALWGTAGFRFIRNYFFNDTAAISQPKTVVNIKNLAVQRDTFILKTIERDPFLNKIVVTGNEDAIPVHKAVPGYTSHTATPVKHSVAGLTWPEVAYFGYIKSGKSQEVALVKINGRLFRMHKNELKEGVFIKNISRDSINVTFNKEKRNFWRRKDNPQGIITAQN